MHAIHIADDSTLVWQARQSAEVGPGQVRIHIAATAVNRADLMQCKGLYPAPPGYSDIPGLECSGTVVEVGPDVDIVTTGMPVCALLAAGGYADEVVCDAGQVLPIPEGISLQHAAALPEVFATAWHNLHRLAGVKPGEKILLKAGGSGVGTAAIQLSRVFNNPVYVQVGDDDKLTRCIELGAAGGINRHRQSLQELKSSGPFDVVLDPVSGQTLNETLALLNTDGRLIVIGLMGGARSELDIGRLLIKRLKVIGSTLRSQPVKVKEQIMSDLFEYVWPKIVDGSIKPVIEAVMPIAKVEQAHALLESNTTFGKIIMTVDD